MTFEQRAPEPRAFTMYRGSDSSGVSGTGAVLEGVIFTTGKVAINWLTPKPSGSLNLWDSWGMFVDIHIRPHPENETRIEFTDGFVLTQSPDGELVASVPSL